MPGNGNLNLTALSAREEGLARVALANTPQDGLRPGRSAAVGQSDRSALILAPDNASGEQPGMDGGPPANTEVEVPESRE